MSETATGKRRRWPWLLLAASLLLTGGSIAWRFRPLNSTERQLVGTWIHADGRETRLQFSETRQFDGMSIRVLTDPLNRTVYIFEPVEGVRWTASESRIQLRLAGDAGAGAGAGLPILTRLSIPFRNLVLGKNVVEMPLTIEGPDRIIVSDRLFVRVPE